MRHRELVRDADALLWPVIIKEPSGPGYVNRVDRASLMSGKRHRYSEAGGGTSASSTWRSRAKPMRFNHSFTNDML